MKQRLHPIELTLMIVAALALTSGAVALHTQSQLAEKVVRLHVLANSDSEEDQALKLKVRDAVLEVTAPLLEGCTVYDYETDSTGGVYDLTAAEKAPYDLFLGGPKALLRIENPAADNDRTLIVFRDSFGSSLVPLLVGSYRTVYVVDIRYMATDALARVTEFPEGADVLLLYSVAVLQNSITLK